MSGLGGKGEHEYPVEQCGNTLAHPGHIRVMVDRERTWLARCEGLDVAVAYQDVGELVRRHRYAGIGGCSCGWRAKVALREGKWEDQHDAHVTEVMIEHVRGLQEDAWTRGWEHRHGWDPASTWALPEQTRDDNPFRRERST